MKLTTLLSIAFASALFALATPAQAQHPTGGHAPAAVAHGGGSYHGGYYHGYPGHYYWHGRYYGGAYFGGFGYPFYGYPYWGYPYYYGYAYPSPYYGAPEQGYAYDPQGVYNGQLANGNGGGRLSLTAQVQQELAAAGYYRGPIDGVAGDGTRRAIRNFQRDHGMTVNGRVSAELLQRPQARG